jgi:hypothetical protein
MFVDIRRECINGTVCGITMERGRGAGLLFVGGLLILLLNLLVCFVSVFILTKSMANVPVYPDPIRLENAAMLLVAANAVILTIPAALLMISGIIIRRGGDSELWPRIGFVAAVSGILSGIATPLMLFTDSSLPNAIAVFIPSVVSVMRVGMQIAASGELPLAVLIPIPILFVLGYAFGLVGSVYSLGRKNARYMRNAFAGFVAVVLILSAISAYLVAYENAQALESMNGQIAATGSNLEYLLQNQSASYVTGGGGLASLVSVSGNIQEMLATMLNQSGSSIGIYAGTAAGYDWNAHNPITELAADAAFYGTLGQSAGQGTLENESDLKLLYMLDFTGETTLANAEYLGMLFGCEAFNSSAAAYPQKKIGIGMTVQHPSYLTGGISTTNYQGTGTELMPLSRGWLELIFDTGAYSRIPSKCKDGSVMTHGDFYHLLSLSEYEDYMYSEMFSGVTLHPSVSFIGYDGNSLVIDMGNIDLSSPEAEIMIDGKPINYTRYYNFLVSNVELGVGLHNITAYMPTEGFLQSRSLYVSPYLDILFAVSANGTGTLSIENRQGGDINLSNLHLSVSPTAFDSGGYAAGGWQDPTSQYQGGIALGYNAPSNNATIVYRGLMPGGCIVGTPYIYYISFNTSEGAAHYTAGGKCA